MVVNIRIGILLAHEKSPYEGRVRPFINWVKKLSECHEVYLFLYKCGKQLVEVVEKIEKVQVENLNTFNELIESLNKNNLDILLSDDYFSRLRLLTKLKGRTKIKTAVYIQILFATHSILDVFNINLLTLRERLLFEAMKYIPFNLIKKEYKKLLREQDIIIANSKITANLLHILYGIEPTGIVYPPVDTNIFRPKAKRKKKQVVVYLGSNAGDTSEDFILEICKILRDKGFKILTMGNEIIKQRLRQKIEISPLPKVSDEMLAKIYSESLLTVCPQKFETFGYVPAESMACGTPVLAFNCMGPSEIILNGKTGFLVQNKTEFLETLSSILEREIKINHNFISKYARSKFSIEASTKKLEEILVKV
jgi:glycosyltransferase involved in cell wall biosynthesis